MHEYPVTKQIIETASKYAKENHAGKVRRINLVVGDYCGYVASSIELYFDIIAQGSPCEGAVLNISRVKPELKCDACGEFFVREPFSFKCPFCGGEGGPTEKGREFYIKSIEV